MELELIRKVRTAISTIGELSVDGIFECYILEDKDRGLKKEMAISELINKKIKTKTAIPEGRYEVVVSYSNRFKKLLPLLQNVPAFEGIRIHPGNKAEHTEGCLLPGKNKAVDFVSSSRLAFAALFEKIQEAMKKEKVFITIS